MPASAVILFLGFLFRLIKKKKQNKKSCNSLFMFNFFLKINKGVKKRVRLLVCLN